MTMPHRRLLSIWLPTLAIDRWQQTAPAELATLPVALTADSAHGPRVAAVNRAAAEAGVQVGARLADMRPLCPQLQTCPHDPAGDRALLERLALWARRWGPWSALDGPDGLLVDITGASHLHGGETAVLADVAARLNSNGLQARAAIAPTCGAAWALSHHVLAGPAICPPDAVLAEWLAPLPVAALRLDETVLLVLKRLGIKHVGDLVAVDRQLIARRFRHHRAPTGNPLARLDQLLGLMPEPLIPVVDRPVALAERRLADPLLHRSLLDRIVHDLAQELEALLEARREGARRLILRLFRVDGESCERTLELAAPNRDAAHIVRLFAGKLDDIDAGFGIDCAQLVAPWTEALGQAQVRLDEPPREGTTLPACLDRVITRLGTGAVHRVVTLASHLPERSQGEAAALSNAPQSASAPPVRLRPLKLLDRPEAIAVIYATPEGLPRSFRWRGQLHRVTYARGPERLGPEWWRQHSRERPRDYYATQAANGGHYWIYRQGHVYDQTGTPPEWFLHGIGITQH